MKSFLLVAAAYLGTVVLGQAGAGIYSLQNSSCNYCPEGQYPAPKPWTGTVSGCGPGNGLIADLIPEYRFGDCCDGHDECYGTCGNIKENCDRRFFACMLRTCDEDIPDDESRNRRCKAVASCYAGAVIQVDDVSCDSYKDNNVESQCECVANTDGISFPVPPQEDDYAEIPSDPDCSIGALTGISDTSDSSKVIAVFGLAVLGVSAVLF